MRPSAVLASLKTLIAAKQPVMLHGSPGVGKSQIVKQVAKELNLQLIDLRLSQLDSVDLRGLPVVSDGKTAWATPSFLPTEGNGILFLDEINSAPQTVQAAAYQLVLDRKLGEYTLPDGWVVVAAGNKMTDFAIVNQMSSALRNRFAHIDYDIHLDDWMEWAVKAGIHHTIIGFLRFRPQLLNEVDAADTAQKRQLLKDAKAFATPRSWEFLSRVLHAGGREPELLDGIIGQGVGVEYRAFLAAYDKLPDIDKLLADPKHGTMPTDPATLYALTSLLVARTTKDNVATIHEILQRLPVEYQTRTMVLLVKADRSLITHPALQKWIAANASALV